MFNPRSTRSPTPAGLPLGYFCMNVQSALHAEPDVPHGGRSGSRTECSIRAPRGARRMRFLQKRSKFGNVQSALHAEPDQCL